MNYRFIILTLLSSTRLPFFTAAFQPQQPQQQTPRRVGSINARSVAAPPDERFLIASSSSPWPVLGVSDHAILTKAQEQKLGKAIQRSRKLRQWLEQQQKKSNEYQTPLPDIADDAVYALAPYHNYTQAQVDAILERGHRAKQTLMMHNLKLVAAIAKKWAYMTHNSNADEYTSSPYYGSWTRPSLQEAIQEGIVGLAKAAERYEPNRNWRFSTYATYWITNSIRLCYTKASTGHAMRLPTKYYETLGKYKALIKQQYEVNQGAPPMEDLAAQMGIRLSRLQQILRLTQPPLSLDSPLRGVATAGKSGLAEKQSESTLGETLLLDTNNDPEARVEWSLLRQALDHAMATHLSPHERDVVRLRLGLDDGITRTCRQVSEDCYEERFRTVDIQITWSRALKKLRSPQALSEYQWMSYFELCNVDLETVSLR